MRWWLSRVVLPLLVLVLAAGSVGLLVLLRPRTERGAAPAHVEPVEVVAVEIATRPAVVHGTGEVVPARRVDVVPQVGGTVTWLSEAAVPGGRLAAGELLARIDDRDYELAVRQQQSAVRSAELELSLEEARQEVARREWDLLGEGPAEEAPLALRRPHLEAARLAVEAARSGLEKARLDLERTRLRAPFDSVVVSEDLDPGQVVGPGAPVATLVGTERLWIDVSLAVEELDLVHIPGISAGEGSPVQVVQRLEEGAIRREGRVLRLGGQLDPQTRTARLTVVVPDPMPPGELPLLPGAYVEVEIEGPRIEGVAEIPRTALVDGDHVWVLDDEDTLRRRPVRVGWSDATRAWVTRGLEGGERVVTSPISLPVEGTPARVVDGEPS